ncbi:MAG: 50S ribosomal protein L30 [Paracholeplasma sp.]|jgi:large subunit ribosomal protein L30|uniref:50S ribosomal protein L30 n=1 Tax=Acholeplasma brassicae TaxID=61635 RepID=U4KQY9_9MOLU|nr:MULTISPECIES: 50S ribosomal protein L30 [Paracholeplasma]MDY3196072.1 50S ribosomal protein L30 [Paracholeplasma sp.]CCV65273.1 50S ribosomal protein L30 [Paracholeplasma brassicae]HBT59347.1 50S ribosomal protein L30 [Acholeplasmataceae bacterium]
MKIEITLKKSLIGRKQNQVKTAHALGLRKLNSSVVKERNEAIDGMVNTIAHLVTVKEIA